MGVQVNAVWRELNGGAERNEPMRGGGVTRP